MDSFYFTCTPWAYFFLLHQQNSVWSGSKTTRLQLQKRRHSEPPAGVPDTTLIPLQQVNFELDKCLNWLFSADFLVYMGFTKRSQPQCRKKKNLAQSLSAQQQQQPMFRACSPVPVLGGVIRPSAPHWHERSLFILDQSVCLFIKGFDHSTPWPPGSNYPPAAVIRFTLSPGQFGNILCFYVLFFCLNCSAYSLPPCISCFSLSLSLSGARPHCWVIFLPNDGLSPRLRPSQSKQGLDSASLQ